MASAPPPPPGTPAQRLSSKEWPAGGEALQAVQKEVAELRDGLMGHGGLFPAKGALEELRDGQRAAEQQRLRDKTEYHERFDKLETTLPDTIIQKLNGTYVKTADLPKALDAALAARRRRRWKRAIGSVGSLARKQGVQLLVGIAIIVLAALILGHTASGGNVP